MLLREFDQPLVQVLHHEVRQHRAGRRALRKDTFVLGLVRRNCRPPLRISLQSAPDELHRRQPRQFEGDKSGIAKPIEHGGDTALRYGVEEIHDVRLEQPFASAMLLRREDRTTARVVGEARTRRFGEAKHVLRDPLLYFEQAPWRNADDPAPAPAGNALFEVYMAEPAQDGRPPAAGIRIVRPSARLDAEVSGSELGADLSAECVRSSRSPARGSWDQFPDDVLSTDSAESSVGTPTSTHHGG